MSLTRSAARRSTGSVAALIGVFALLLSSAAPATAAPGPANIDESRNGSITIHKFEQPAAAGDAHTGDELGESQTAALEPLQGVEFTISRIDGVDLGSAAGWTKAERLQAAPIEEVIAEQRSHLGSSRTVVTNSEGVAATDGTLPLGLYLVEETGFGKNQIIQPTAPFLIGIPTPVNDEWLYDVHAYPKNSVVGIDMQVDDSRALGMNRNPEQTVDWTVQSSIPYLPRGEKFQSFAVSVEIDRGLEPAGEVAMTVGEYDIPAEMARISPEGVLTIEASGAELGYLSDYQGYPLRMTIPSHVVGNNHDSGVIANTASIHVNDTKYSATAKTSWGAVKIITHRGGDSADMSDRIAGGEYQVTRQSDGKVVSFGEAGTTSFTSDENGEVLIPGLRAGEKFWIEETQAPRGYTASERIGLEVSAAGTTLVSSAGADHNNVVSVPKTQVPGFALPSTGSFGSLPFLLAGLLLVVTALIINRQRRRRLAQAV